MDLIQVLFLSFIQGLTEFLPISSSAHLILFSDFFNSNIQSLNFDISVHLGTLIAACVYFKDEISQILNSFSSSDKASIGKKLLVNLTIATLPILIIGFFVRDLVEIFLRSPEIIAYTTIFFAVIMFLLSRLYIFDNAILDRLILGLIILAMIEHGIILDRFFDESDNKIGIIIDNEVEAYSGPFYGDNTILFKVNEGTKVRINQNQNNWIEIILLDGNRAWVPKEKIRQI